MITTQQFEKMYREYYSRLYYYAYDYVEDIEVCKDIVSEVFSRVWNERERMDEGTIVNYLYVSVRNQCLSHLKKEQNRNDYQEYCIQILSEEEEEDWRVNEERMTELCAEIEKLPPRTRYVLEECYFHNKKYKEVADVLEITPDGIKKHITKAFAMLREHFNVKKQ